MVYDYTLAERLSYCCVACMTQHMSGDERSHWRALDELRREANEKAAQQAKAEPKHSRSYTHRSPRSRGRRR